MSRSRSEKCVRLNLLSRRFIHLSRVRFIPHLRSYPSPSDAPPPSPPTVDGHRLLCLRPQFEQAAMALPDSQRIRSHAHADLEDRTSIQRDLAAMVMVGHLPPPSPRRTSPDLTGGGLGWLGSRDQQQVGAPVGDRPPHCLALPGPCSSDVMREDRLLLSSPTQCRELARRRHSSHLLGLLPLLSGDVHIKFGFLHRLHPVPSTQGTLTCARPAVRLDGRHGLHLRPLAGVVDATPGQEQVLDAKFCAGQAQIVWACSSQFEFLHRLRLVLSTQGLNRRSCSTARTISSH